MPEAVEKADLPHFQSEYFRRWTAVSALALFIATWRLWTPQEVFPQVPFFEGLVNTPGWIDWLLIAAVLVALVVMAIRQSIPASIYFSLTCLIVGLVVLNQHRLQPWAYELALVTLAFACCGKHLALQLIKWLLISLYIYSALGKLDFQFVHTVGQQMLTTVMKLAFLDDKLLSPSTRNAIVLLFPLTELIIGLGLCWNRTRRLAGVLAVALHLTLIVILGPLGLGHKLGVLLWNLQIAGQVWLLFVYKPASNVEDPGTASKVKRLISAVAVCVFSVAMLLPISERFGLYDHWPSWALYAPHSSRVRVEVATPALKKLPEELRSRATPGNNTLWHSLALNAWSLDTLSTPIYPQARFQTGVARSLTKYLEEYEIRVTVLGAGARLDGQRSSTTLDGKRALEAAERYYWLNTRPRSLD